MTESNTRIIGIGYMLAAMLIFSAANAVVKDIITNYSVMQILFFRTTFALVPLLYLMMREGGLKIMKTDQIPRFIMMGIVGTVALMGLFESLARMPLAEAVSIHFSETFILTALSAWILKEKVGPQAWAAILVGFLGVLLIFRPTGEILNVGAVYGLIFAIGDSIYMLNSRILTRTHSSTAVVIYFGMVIILITGVSLFFDWKTPPLEDWIRLFVMGFGAGMGMYCVTQAYRHAPASTVAPMIYSALIWNMLMDYLIWHKAPDATFLAGASLIVGSGLYIIYRETRQHVEITAAAPTAIPDHEEEKITPSS